MQNIKAHLALFLVSLIYATNYTVAKEVMPEYIPPLGIVTLRVIFGAAAFWLFHLLFVREKVDKSDFPRLIACGLFGVAINQIFFFKGLNWTTPINASMLMLTAPIVVLLFSVALSIERLTMRKIAGIIIGIIGAGLLIGYGQEIAFTKQGMWGDILVFLNASSYAIYIVIVRDLMRKYNPITVIKWVFAFGLIFTLPFTISDLQYVDWAAIPVVIWFFILFILICVTFLTYLFNGYALSKLPPSIVSIYIYSQPVLAAIIAISANKDSLSAMKLTASGLIFFAVYLVSFQSPKLSKG